MYCVQIWYISIYNTCLLSPEPTTLVNPWYEGQYYVDYSQNVLECSITVHRKSSSSMRCRRAAKNDMDKPSISTHSYSFQTVPVSPLLH